MKKQKNRQWVGPQAALVLICVLMGMFALGAFWTRPVLAQAKSGVSKQTEPKKTPAKNPPKGSTVRTLEAINIDGEIAVPQVLFITSNQYRRFRDGTALKFRLSSLEVARSADLPTRLRVVAYTKEEGK